MSLSLELDRLGPYRIEGVAARGGMATIFRGVQEQTGRAVAIKVPHPGAERPLRHEFEILRRLNHPGVVKVFDSRECGRPCLVMEWAEGQSLRKILSDAGALAPEAAVRIALAVCDALAYVHSRGVAHRDLKPENIVVDAQGHVKILDFGVATGGAFFMPDAPRQATGTPDYISPEQVLGKRGDARSDIYALGVMLYEMLTGTVPFAGPNALAVMNDRLRNAPTPPRELNPAIPAELEKAVCRALERDPKRRYASVRDLARALGIPRRPQPIESRARRVLSYLALGMIPGTIFALLLYAASHQ
jgi:serine/threonine-protein kinase